MGQISEGDKGSLIVTLNAPVTKAGAGGSSMTVDALTFTRFKVKHLRTIDASRLESGNIDTKTTIDLAEELCTHPWAVDEIEDYEDFENVLIAAQKQMGKFLPAAPEDAGTTTS